MYQHDKQLRNLQESWKRLSEAIDGIEEQFYNDLFNSAEVVEYVEEEPEYDEIEGLQTDVDDWDMIKVKYTTHNIKLKSSFAFPKQQINSFLEQTNQNELSVRSLNEYFQKFSDEGEEFLQELPGPHEQIVESTIRVFDVKYDGSQITVFYGYKIIIMEEENSDSDEGYEPDYDY